MKKLFQNEMARNIIFLLVGIALAAGSFLVYFFSEDGIGPLIIVLSAADLIFTYLNGVSLLSDSDNKWRKAFVITFLYFAIFNGAPIIYLLFTENLSLLSTIWLDVLMYSFFCGPLLIILIILVSIALIIIGWLNGH